MRVKFTKCSLQPSKFKITPQKRWVGTFLLGPGSFLGAGYLQLGRWIICWWRWSSALSGDLPRKKWVKWCVSDVLKGGQESKASWFLFLTLKLVNHKPCWFPFFFEGIKYPSNNFYSEWYQWWGWHHMNHITVIQRFRVNSPSNSTPNRHVSFDLPPRPRAF